MGGDPSAARMCMGHAMVHELPQRCMADMVSMRPQHGPQQSTFGMADNSYNCRFVLLKPIIKFALVHEPVPLLVLHGLQIQ